MKIEKLYDCHENAYFFILFLWNMILKDIVRIYTCITCKKSTFLYLVSISTSMPSNTWSYKLFMISLQVMVNNLFVTIMLYYI